MDQHTKEEWVREASVSSSRVIVPPSGRKQSETHCIKEEQNFKEFWTTNAWGGNVCFKRSKREDPSSRDMGRGISAVAEDFMNC